jgi:energy-coupling factor transporter transmembrane protein EcfT
MYFKHSTLPHDTLRPFDPRARLIAGTLFILVSVYITQPMLLAYIIGACILLLRRDFFCVLKRLVPPAAFCVLFLPQALCGFLSGRQALVFILRIHAAALLYILTVAGMGPGALAQALAALRVNPKLISILYLSYRYIYMMNDTVFCAVKALRLRKNSNNNGVVFVWKSYAAVFATAICSAFIKAEGIGAALLSRGFDGRIPQTAVWRWRTKDSVLVAVSLLGAVIYGTYTIIQHFFFL